MPKKINVPQDIQHIEHPDYKNEIVEIVKGNYSPKILKDKILDYHENDIADALEILDKENRHKVFNILDGETLSAILEYSDEVKKYFSELTLRKKLDILIHSEADVAVDYLDEVDEKERKTLIDLMDNDTKEDISLIDSFDDEEIGSRITTNFICINYGVSVREATKELIKQASEHDNVSTIYVVDNDEVFYGAIDLKDLIVARDGTNLDEIIVKSYPYVYGNELVADCIERIKDYCEDSIPVLDSTNKLIGVMTSQDIVEIVDDEMGEDYAKFAGLAAEEDLSEPLFKSIKKRFPWLVVLLFLGMIVSSVVGMFEHVVASLALLVSFQSLVLDMSGNVGTQSLAVTIRVLMDEQLTGKQKLKLVAKEGRVGFINGLILGTASFIFIGLFILLFKHQPAHIAFGISSCTGIALLVSMFLSSLSGTVIPIIFKKLKIDPAVASGPLITTVNDLIAVVAYYGLAWILLLNIMKI